VPRSKDLAEHIAALIRHRREHWEDTVTLCQESGLDPVIAESVERNGMHAPLAHIHSYADAIGLDTALHVAPQGNRHRAHQSCEECGRQPTLHRQTHLSALDACVDAGLANLLDALFNLSIRTALSCEGGSHDDAHLVFPTLDDARAFFSIVDRGDESLRLRAGLRPLSPRDIGKAKFRTWEHSIRWFLQPGDLLADATVWVRFAPSEIKGLSRLMASPPPPPPLAQRRFRD
jgi:hypothetical protein